MTDPRLSNIIVFPARTHPGGVCCEPIGVTFPAVHRVTGFFFAGDLETRTVDLETRGEKAPLHYTLSDDDKCGLMDCRWDPIDRLDPWKDATSLVIRHHKNRDRVDGYIDALLDLRRDSTEGPTGGTLFQTLEGLFTLAAIETAPWWPGPMLVYGANIPPPPGSPLDSECWTLVIDPTGQRLDETIFWPPENDGAIAGRRDD